MRYQMGPDILPRAKAEPDERKYRQRHNAGQRQTAPQPAIAPNLAWGAQRPRDVCGRHQQKSEKICALWVSPLKQARGAIKNYFQPDCKRNEVNK